MATTQKLNPTLQNFIKAQHLFFVATAAPDGRVNLSPKGCNSLHIVDDNRIIWLNLSGSDNETAAHLRELNRMTLMFCAFEGDARILRLYRSAHIYHPRDEKWDKYIKLFPQMAGSRQIFDMTIDLVQSSCGTGVPIMEFKQPRADTEMLPFYQDMGTDGVKDYWQRKNALSIDNRPTGIIRETE